MFPAKSHVQIEFPNGKTTRGNFVKMEGGFAIVAIRSPLHPKCIQGWYNPNVDKVTLLGDGTGGPCR